MLSRRCFSARVVARASAAQCASSARNRLSGRVTSVLRPHPMGEHKQLQVRSFFGLRELLFGKQEEKKEPASEQEEINKPVETKTPVVAAVDNTAADAEQPSEPLVGSLDETTFVVGKYARLADGAVMAHCGKTMVLTTAVSSASNGRRGRDFLPLMVDYRVKYYAVGQIPNTARRTEFNGNEEEILQSRVIDRVIRPLFPRGFADDTQLIATVQAFDADNDPLVVAINSASAALCVSDIPWNGPVGCVRVVEVDGQLIANPTAKQKELATMDILYAANESRVLMIEAEGEEIPEARMAEALRFAHDAVGPIIDEQKRLMAAQGKLKRAFAAPFMDTTVWEKAKEIGYQDAMDVLSAAKDSKVARQVGEKHVYGKIVSGLRAAFADGEYDEATFQLAAHDVFQTALRDRILQQQSRYDGRSATTIRPLSTETNVLTTAHGSALFTRGDTQALCAVTLGPLERGLRVRSATVDPSDDQELKHAMLHYEFPPYCVNETGRIGGVNRRMIGHGALAEKAIVPVIPPISEFPYTIRMTSETMGSDGSSSMATVCGVSMALMDAGVPVKKPVAGISIGLVTEGDPFDGQKAIDKYQLITDILGTEDHYGDMDFKVAGTDDGITAIQLDVKLPGIPLEILCEGIEQAKRARSQILTTMNQTIAQPRAELKLSPNGLPDVSIHFAVPVSTIGSIIGAGGQNIRSLEEQSGCTLSIDRKEGMITVVGAADKVETAKELVLAQTEQGSFFKTGDKYTMRVTEVLDFGAILESTAPTKNRGFVHITELSHARVENIHSELQVGQELEFACIQEGVSGKMSRKALLAPASETSSSSSSSQQPVVRVSHRPSNQRPSSPATKRRPRSPHAGAHGGGKHAGPRSSTSSHRRSSSPPAAACQTSEKK